MAVKLAFDGRDLLPVVAQDRVTGEIRMLAYANAEAVRRTLATGRATFYSRSRSAIWEKGSTSGHTLDVSAVLVDCDADSLVYLVTPHGPSCHTGAPTCFFRRLEASSGEVRDDDVPQSTLLARLEAVLETRKAASSSASYTKSLYDGGATLIGAKLREEAAELAHALAVESDERVTSEAADVLFHMMVALRARGVGIEGVLRELERRTGKSGLDEKRTRRPLPTDEE
jgi:phosphoribosyl-AMP cyclohydrolase / phosphoribosyl-ATP pyrophosphohydrolase